MGATPEAAVIGEGEGACVSPGGNRGSAPGRSSITTQRGNSEDQDWELTRARVAGRHRRWGVFLARRGDFRRNWDRNGVAVSHWTGISGRKRHATSACPILVARGIHLYNWIRRNIGASPTPSAMRSRSSPTGSESRQATWEGHLMWLINLLIAIAAWIAVCAAIIKLVEALP
jgi:hypothetical protein